LTTQRHQKNAIPLRRGGSASTRKSSLVGVEVDHLPPRNRPTLPYFLGQRIKFSRIHQSMHQRLVPHRARQIVADPVPLPPPDQVLDQVMRQVPLQVLNLVLHQVLPPVLPQVLPPVAPQVRLLVLDPVLGRVLAQALLLAQDQAQLPVAPLARRRVPHLVLLRV
jgi:hypothetical protein